MSTLGSTLYCGENCNHTGPHRYPPPPSVIANRPFQGGARRTVVYEIPQSVEVPVDEPLDYAEIYLGDTGRPSFEQIDGYLLRHFDARAVYVKR